MNCKITLRELIRRCKKNGPWRLTEYGYIRNSSGYCPLEAAAGTGYAEAKCKLGFADFTEPLTALAADNIKFIPGPVSKAKRVRYIRKVLIRELITR